MHLSNESRSGLAWWVNNVDSSLKAIVQGGPDLTLTTDACIRGWGAVYGVQTTSGLRNLEEQAFHINYLNLKVVLLGLKSLFSHVHSKNIRITSNNTTTVAYVNNMGAYNLSSVIVWLRKFVCGVWGETAGLVPVTYLVLLM